MCSLPGWNRFEKAWQMPLGAGPPLNMAAPNCDRNLNFIHGDSPVTARLQDCFRKELWERQMLAKHSSGSANGFVGWYDTPGNGERGDISTARMRGPAEPDSVPPVIASITEADRGKPALWSSVVNFFVEGLAACGTSLHPVMFFTEQPVPLDLEREAGRTMPAECAMAPADDGSVKREREIGKAVAALETLDDRTLRGLGIRHRSHIEQTVRYCHEC
jgi:hypothetical protein